MNCERKIDACYWDGQAREKEKNLSKPVHEIRVEKDRPIVMKDDVRLYCDVYRPDDREKYPVLVGFSPFGKTAQAAGRLRDPIQLGKFMYEQGIEVSGIDYFASRGYIVVVVNPRGILNSEGKCTGVLSRQDQIDCCEVIRWAGHYLSDGNVGMIGCGYAGKIQPLVAAMNPPYLRAIMPVDVIDDLYMDCYPGGILSDINYPLCSYIPHTNTISEAELEHSEQELKEMLEAARHQPEIATNSYYYRGLDSFPPRHYTWNIDVMLHPFQSEWWGRRSFGDREVRVPTYIVGLYYEYGYSTISAYDIYNKLDDAVPKKLMMIDPATARTSPYEKPVPEQLRWYDYWLKGIDSGIMEEPPMKLLVTGENKYRYETQWPCADTRYEKIYLRKGGTLSEVPEDSAQVQPDRIRHIPPTKLSQMPEDVPALVYTSEVFTEDTEVCGPVTACLHAAIDLDDAHLSVKLWDKDKNSGYRTLLSTGYLKCSRRGLSPDSREHRPKNIHTKEEPVVPGKIYEYIFEMAPVDNMFKIGHQAEVEFKTMDQQYFDFNEMASLPRLYTSGRVAGPHPLSREVNFSIYVDGAHDSWVELPFVGKEKNWVESMGGHDGK